MKLKALSFVFAASLVGPGLANAQASQLAHDEKVLADIRVAHEQALKSGDKVAIARTDAQARAAYADIADDKKDAALMAAGPAKGDTRASEVDLINAKEAHQRALASGDEAAIKSTDAALRAAYARDYAIRHGDRPAH